MATNLDYARVSQDNWGRPYNADGGRFGQDHYDCSGHCVESHRELWLGSPHWRNGTLALVSSTLFALCRDEGHLVPFWAPAQPGELLFMPANPLLGNGPKGHVCMVALDTRKTSEARGHAYGVGSWPIAGRAWSGFRGRLPALQFVEGVPVPAAGVVKSTSKAAQDFANFVALVKMGWAHMAKVPWDVSQAKARPFERWIVQQYLMKHGYSIGVLGVLTKWAIMHAQKDAGVAPTGVVDAATIKKWPV